MKKNNKSIGILIAGVIVVLAVIITAGILFYNQSKSTTGMDGNNSGAIDLTGYPNTGDIVIQSASYLYTSDGKIDGFLVTAKSKGYKSDLLLDITFDSTGDTVKSVAVKNQKESKGYGDKITDPAFLSQFNGITAPVSISGEDLNSTDNQTSSDDVNSTEPTTDAQTSEPKTTETDTSETNTVSETSGNVLADGTYEAEEPEFDDQGYKDKVTLTIENGKMTEVIWDAYNDKGELKSVLSADGIYEMEGGGLTWQEQALAITDYLVKQQSIDTITMNAEGKTDAVTGVTISVRDFINLVQECLKDAAAKKPEVNTQEESTSEQTSGNETVPESAEEPQSAATPDNTPGLSTKVDVVSGATVSSTAVINSINKAQEFIKEFVLSK
ncbi:FMN-binding protein [Anaerocolumna sp. AGMB13025]|uniref:FMN-binding protein n=1 Tax=Anaerocolumna sp. AGMB13025 TaxID=3039116 RepID=UPI00241DA378|nr:FMN-binding protein [Anaerocolumna sp. AGMB13025]WFR57764.1 FMN-binding protein [Anaerocolumna sp. AGMB13025]